MRHMRNYYPFCTVRHSKFLADYLGNFCEAGASEILTSA
jgi:hypothetical protein